MGLLDNLQILSGKKKIPVTPLPRITPKRTILIVEDEKPLATVLADRFAREEFNVLTATNGQEGLAMTIAHKPDIVLLDLLMPVMDGKVMLAKVRELPEFKTLPVVVLTNAGEVENIRQTKTLHDAISFMIKSNVTLDQIVERVKLIIR